MVDYKDRLAAAMKEAGVTKTQLAARLGVSYQAIKKLIDGVSHSMTAANNAAAAAYLQVSSEWLATGKGPMRLVGDAHSHTQGDKVAPAETQDIRDEWLDEAVRLLRDLSANDRRAAVLNLRMFVAMLAPPASGQALHVAGKKRSH